MANRDNPHGFRPLMRCLNGAPCGISPAHKLVGYGTALFIGDAVTLVASGTKKTPAISAAITPGTTPVFGVNLVYGAASTATDHACVRAAGGAVFEVQDNNDTDGVEVASLNKNANIELNAGNTTTKVSGHELDESTINTTNTLDLKLVGIFDAPDNDWGAWCRVEVVFNNLQQQNQVAGI